MELEKRVLKTIAMLNDAKRLMHDSFNMLFTKDHVKFSYVNRSKFLVRVRFYYWRLTVIEFAKLFSHSRNENFRIVRLLEDIITNYDDIDWKKPLSKKESEAMLSKLKSDEICHHISSLIELRNQHFAHSDMKPKRNEYEVELYYIQLNSLLNIGEEILDKIAYSLFLKNDLIVDYNGEDTIDYLDEIIAEKEELGKFILHSK